MHRQHFTLKDAIRFYETHGRMPFPLAGGDDDPPNPDPDKGKGKESEAKFTQADVEREVKNRIAAELATAKEDLKTQIMTDIQKKADQELEIKKGNFDKVLSEKDAELLKFSGVQARLDQYEEAAKQRQGQLVKDLPESIKLLMPDDLDPLGFDKWYSTKAMPALAKMDKEGKTRGNNPKDPPGGNLSETEKLIQAEIKKMSKSGLYRF